MTLPLLREDLVLRRQDAADREHYILKDPSTGRFFRLREVEHFIAEQLDGNATLDEIRARVEARYEADLAPAALQAFIDRLDRSGLLERPGARRHGSRSGRRIRGSLLYLRFPLFDPDRVFTWVAARCGLLFTREAVFAGAGLIALASWITLLNGGTIAAHLSQFRGTWVFFVLLLLVLASVSLHECAHGLACKHFGGEVHEMGFMLVYFQPAFYCNVSDAWLIPEKAKRLWIGFAGIALELTFWAIGTIIWRIVEPGSWPSLLALALLTTSGIKCILNLNPFIKLDGYYILSDWLDLPNLRKKGFRYAGDFMCALFGLPPGPPLVATPREKRILLTYGLVAAFASALAIGYVIFRAGVHLIELHRPGALALLGVAVGLKVQRRFRRLFGGRPDPADNDPEDPPDVVATIGSEGVTPAEPAPPPPRDPMVTRKRLWMLAGVATVLYVGFGKAQLRIGGPFTLVPARTSEVRTQIAGVVDRILVDEGEQLRAGTPIARLSTRDLGVELAKTDAQLLQARANLAKLRAGPTAPELDVARAQEQTARDRLGFARTAAGRMSELTRVNGASQSELDSAQAEATAAVNGLAEAQSRLRLLQAGSRPEDVAGAVAQVEQLQAQRDFLVQQVGLATVVSDVDGVVATPERELQALRGQRVAPGDLIARVFSFRTIVAQIVIPEAEIADIQVGQPVALRARAFPARVFTGKVTAIAPAAEGSTALPIDAATAAPTAGQSTPMRAFLVTTTIDNPELLLKPGMTGQVKVLGGERRIGGLILRRLERVVRVEVWSWW